MVWFMEISTVNCGMARALAVVGERWTLLIVREAFNGVHRFQDFRARLGIASNLLTARLETLVETGVMRRSPYREPGGRQRNEYYLTERGRDLRAVTLALMQWGDKYFADPEGPSVIPRHEAEPACDEPIRVVLECAGGHSHLDGDAVRRTPGPGARFVEDT